MKIICEFCKQPMMDVTNGNQKFHKKSENLECYNKRMRQYWRDASNSYYRKWKSIIKVRKRKGTGSLGGKRVQNNSEEIIKIRKEMRRLGLIKYYNKPITYLKAHEGF